MQIRFLKAKLLLNSREPANGPSLTTYPILVDIPPVLKIYFEFNNSLILTPTIELLREDFDFFWHFDRCFSFWDPIPKIVTTQYF